MPFLLAWIVAWILLTAAIMAVIYRPIRPTGRTSHERRAALHRRRRHSGARRSAFWRGAAGKWASSSGRWPAVRSARRSCSCCIAGEIYTTFTFLGGSGFAYGKGAPAYYILCYGTLAYVLSYFMLPPIWRYAKENRLYSQPDFFVAQIRQSDARRDRRAGRHRGADPVSGAPVQGARHHRRSRRLRRDLLDALRSGSAPSSSTAYVMVSGVHGSAWTSVAKDTMILGIVVFLGIYLPYHYYGGLGSMFAAIEQAKPGFTVLPAHGESLWWFSSTVLLTALGFYMWPHTFGSIYTARKRQGDPQERDRAAALSVDPAVRVFRRLRGDPAGSRARTARISTSRCSSSR